MKVSRAQVDKNRSEILALAGRLFRERGIDDVSLSDVMKAAGLTHGAFYGYFRSKDELAAAALAELTRSDPPTGRFGESVARYLSPEHRDDCAGGCPVAALGPAAERQSAAVRAGVTRGVERMIAQAADVAPGADPAARRRVALARVSAMVGALVLSRAVDDIALSEDLLAATREALGDPTLGG